MASSSCSSSHLHQTEYDVFISFRGSDVRHGFLGHLTKELRRKQIDAYIDERLESGDGISLALVKAIEGSMISLVIFSENYASSKWCLEELVKIMECKESNDQIVIPVFYNIDPSHVRHQKNTYGDAFVNHEPKIKDSKDRLQSWRSALNKAANLSGYHYPSSFKDESKLIEELVEDILEKLQDGSDPVESTRLVGFDRNLAGVESLLAFESQEVRIIGIWGMGGIGKTTLARAICDKYSSKFASFCFMENVREESKKVNGLNHLVHHLCSKLLEEENLYVYNGQAMRSIKRRLSRRKVLIVLDDVDSLMQLQYLSGRQFYFGPGSRVIITSRDKHFLVSGGVHAIHEIKELNFQESLELFSLNAFNQRHPKMGYEELSERAIVYSKGVPLALKVLGLHLHSRNKETWESALNKLQKYPNMEIQNVLKVSYDGLEEVEKNIFLDIAFFFKGYLKDDVTWVLDACDFYATTGIENLLDKALITISDDNIIEMHGLLQEMGEQKVREESIKHPERRSRLKDVEEVFDVLQNNMGTDAIEGISLDVSQIKNVHLSADIFVKMPNLRILKMYSEPWVKGSNVNVPFGFEPFFNKLQYFHWDEYSLESLPQTFCAEKLVVLRMERSQVKKLWDGIKDLIDLKILNLGGSKQLMELPDFCKACNLEKLQLSDCESLSGLHPSIASLKMLASLELTRCHELKTHHMIELGCFTSLKLLSLRGCNQVNKMRLHILCDALHSLESLDLESCNNLHEISDNISSLSLLKNLYISSSGVESLPASMKHLSNLKHFTMNFCNRLRSIPELPTSIKYLHAQFCPSLETVFPFKTCLPQVLEDNEKKDKLNFSF